MLPMIADAGLARVTADPGSCPTDFVAAHRDELDALTLRYGAVLISGLPITSATDVAQVRDCLGRATASCQEPFAVRTALGDGLWSTPDWAADREMCLHHEQAYRLGFPRTLLIGCLTPPQSGGAMLLGDTRSMVDALPADLVARFRQEGWLLERNFRPYFGLPWSTAFGVAAPADVERYCDAELLGWQWRPDGALHVTGRRSAVLTHPITSDECWFNDVAFFSQWSVSAEERAVLLSAFGPSGIPFNTSLGNGEPLDQESWQAILDAYDAVVRRVEWRAGDLLLLDNILTAHGREPYTGAPEFAVALLDPVLLDQCQPSPPPATGR